MVLLHLGIRDSNVDLETCADVSFVFASPDFSETYCDTGRVQFALRVFNQAIDPWMQQNVHFIMVFSAFIIPARKPQRLRNALVILVRGVLFEELKMPHRCDRVYEQAHTFSNPLSLRHPWINLLVMNFGYHNAHHAKPTTPWFRLPALHQELFGDSEERVILFWPSWKSFHRYRVTRVVSDSGSVEGEAYLKLARTGDVSGGNAVSFLTSF